MIWRKLDALQIQQLLCNIPSNYLHLFIFLFITVYLHLYILITRSVQPKRKGRMKVLITLFTMLMALTINGKVPKPFHSEKTPFIYGVRSFNKSLGAMPSDYDITLVKGLAFNHKFLLKTSIISSLPVPTGRSLSSKVVKFERKGKTVYLFESSTGKLSSLSLPTKILLAEFPILWETEKTITIDFKKGISFYIN